jgi:predicted permease
MAMAWTKFFRRTKWDRERREEIESYLDLETRENLARGMREDEARAAARRKLGNSTRIREEIYGMNTIGWLDSFCRDVRYALRGLRRNPTFTGVALLTLAIGIGANTAVFSVVNSVLLKPLNYPNPEQLVQVRQLAPGAKGLGSPDEGLALSASMYFTYAEQNRAFQSLGVWSPGLVTVTGLAEPETVRAIFVSDGVLQALDVKPALGQWLSKEDQEPNVLGRAMLSYGYWLRRFGGDKSVMGRSIVTSAVSRDIAGVMPEGFRFLDNDFDLILPISLDRSKAVLPGFDFLGLGRLKPGVTIAQADADIARLVPVWMNSWPWIAGGGTAAPGGQTPSVYEQWRITPALRPLRDEVVRNVGDVLWVVMGTIGLVMIVVAANVANLLLVRAEARQQELAVRSALGAGWGRIVRDLLAESLILALMGGAIGVGLAHEGLHWLIALRPAGLPRLSDISLDATALAFGLGLSIASGLLFGLIPAWKYARRGIALGGRTFSTSRERSRTRNILVVAQVALALILLVSSGLMIRSFAALRTVQPGFTGAERLDTATVMIPVRIAQAPEQVARMQEAILDKIAAIPGVSSAGFADGLPLDGSSPWNNIFAADKTYGATEIPPAREFLYLSPGFLHAMGTRLIAGREFTFAEVYNQRRLAMVSENLARELWGSPEAAIGKQITEIHGMPWWQVIGVVQDVHQEGLDQKAPTMVYWPTLRDNMFGPGPLDAKRNVTFVLRSNLAGTASLRDQVKRAVWSVNSNLPVARVRTMQEIYSRSMARTSFTLVMLAIAGAMALVLGIIGIYGVIAYAVSQRRREIGIRLALGAQQGAIQRAFVKSALMLAGIGVVIGLGAAVVLMRLMKSLLFGISPLDPLTYLTVPIVLAAAAGLASYLPARRAAAVDPVEALRAE